VIMSVLTYALVVVEVLCSILLIGVILIQKTKSQGMGLAFGAGMGETLFGSQMGNVLTKTTVILGIVFLINTTALAFLGARRRESSIADSIPATAPAPAGLPGQPGPGASPLPEGPLSEGVSAGGEAAPEAVLPPVDAVQEVEPIVIGEEGSAAEAPSTEPAAAAPAETPPGAANDRPAPAE